MKLNINYVDLETDKRLNEFIQKKVDKLETFYDRILQGEVYLPQKSLPLLLQKGSFRVRIFSPL